LRIPVETRATSGPTLWLASDLASWVTGEVVEINGGTYFA
jgi:enoyl-[acyl-carrier-protein] reductase (NADH)